MTHCNSIPASLVLLTAICPLNGAAPAPPIGEKLGKLPLAFEKNRGQAPPSVDYLARGGGYSVFLSRGNARIALRHGERTAPVTIGLRLAGSHPEGAAIARRPLPGKVNYFLGSDPSRWRTDIPTFQRVEYTHVYPGIGLAYYGDQGRVEYDFMLAPNSDPHAIRIAVDGAQSLAVDGNGELVLETGSGQVRFRKPVAYQVVSGARREVQSRYLLTASHEVGFAVGPHDRHRALVIDPSLVYSTYLGGTSYDYGKAVAVDADGNAYVTGYTSSVDFPTVNPEQAFYSGTSAIFVSKLAASGSSLIYSTYLAGSSYDASYSIAVDGGGSAYVVGYTSSTDFPVKNPIYGTLNGPDDAFITKFNPAGDALVYSTYLGGSAEDYGYGVAVDANNSAYITGETVSSDFPVTPGAYQTSSDASCGFVTKINANGSALAWSTYFGQDCSANPQAIAVDVNDGVYLTGYTFGGLPVTTGVVQPVFGGAEDAFVSKLNKTGAALVYSTYLGGSEEDYGASIAVDSSGNAYVTGSTASTNLAVTASAPQPTLGGGFDGFVAKLNAAGTAWTYLTYLGGARDDYAYGIALDTSANATVVGSTISVNFPLAAALQPSLSGNTTLLFKTTSTGSSWTASDAGLADTVYSLAIDPSSDTHLMAATDAGLYQSTDGGTQWNSSSTFAGSIVGAVAFSTAGGPVYAASFTSVYSSANRGVTWTFAGTAPCGVGTIAVDPAVPTTLYISNANPSQLFYPGCIAKSVNGGATWTTLTGLTFNYEVAGIAIDPEQPAVLYAATDSGLFKSTDAGQAWTELVFTGFTNPYVTGVALNPAQPAVVYANVYDTLYKSTDAGNAWTSLNQYGVSSFALAPSQPSVIYAGTYGAGMYVSSNAGSSWSPAGLSGDDITVIAVNLTNAAGAYAGVSVNPDAFVAKLNAAGSTLTYSTYLGGTSYDSANGVAVNSSGNAIVVGQTESPDFPSTPGAFEAADGAERATAFVTEVSTQTPACSYTASPASYLFYPFGGPLNLSVVAPSGCEWTATPNVPWITVTSGSGPGVGPLAISVAGNTGAARTGSIAVASANIGILQAASGCTYTLSNPDPAFPQTGGPLSIQVTAAAGCQWNVLDLPTWLTVTSGARGDGNGTVALQAAANPFPGTRYGYPTIAGNFVSASEAGTSGAAIQTGARPSVRMAPRCIPVGAACPAGLVQRPIM